jgi:hypothetical protein
MKLLGAAQDGLDLPTRFGMRRFESCDLSVFHNRRDNAARGAYIVTICLRYFFHRAEAIVCAEVDIAKSCA